MLNVELNQGHVFHSTFNIAFRPSASLPPSPLNRCVPFCASVFHRLPSTVAYRSAFCLLPSAFCLLPSALCLLPSAFCLPRISSRHETFLLGILPSSASHLRSSERP